MIGENIKTLRKTHNLTQPEFDAKIIGHFRNSLELVMRMEQVQFRQN